MCTTVWSIDADTLERPVKIVHVKDLNSPTFVYSYGEFLTFYVSYFFWGHTQLCSGMTSVFRGPYSILGIKSGSPDCKANALPTELLLWSLEFFTFLTCPRTVICCLGLLTKGVKVCLDWLNSRSSLACLILTFLLVPWHNSPAHFGCQTDACQVYESLLLFVFYI